MNYVYTYDFNSDFYLFLQIKRIMYELRYTNQNTLTRIRIVKFYPRSLAHILEYLIQPKCCQLNFY